MNRYEPISDLVSAAENVYDVTGDLGSPIYVREPHCVVCLAVLFTYASTQCTDLKYVRHIGEQDLTQDWDGPDVEDLYVLC